MKLEIAREAQEDFAECLLWSAEYFGIAAARRYQKLIFVALEEIRVTGNPLNSGIRQGIPSEFRFYHLRHSRKEAAIDEIIVKTPRHFIVYRFAENEVIEIVRILHDSMDLQRQLEME